MMMEGGLQKNYQSRVGSRPKGKPGEVKGEREGWGRMDKVSVTDRLTYSRKMTRGDEERRKRESLIGRRRPG